MSSCPPQPTVPPPPAWQEIGRPSPEEAPVWTTWVAPLGDAGDALYRSLVVAEGAITVAVELCPRRKPSARVIHRARCEMPHDLVEAAEQVGALLKAADEAVAGTADADRSGAGRAEEQGRLSRRISGPSPGEGCNATSDPRHEFEHHLRERAYFLWEREGRPEGCAHEFWERACREEARAA
jgi:hypothetical protein